MKGLVYLFRQTGTPFYKIGYTLKNDVNSRFTVFKMYSPLGAEIISVVESDNAFQLEKKMHLLFKDSSTNGEFFCLNESQINVFKTFESDKSKDLQNLFWRIIMENEFTFEDVKSIFRKKSEPIDNDNQHEYLIIEYLHENCNGFKMTNSEINLRVKNDLNIDITNKALGIILKKKYTQKITKIKGTIHRLYQL